MFDLNPKRLNRVKTKGSQFLLKIRRFFIPFHQGVSIRLGIAEKLFLIKKMVMMVIQPSTDWKLAQEFFNFLRKILSALMGF